MINKKGIDIMGNKFDGCLNVLLYVVFYIVFATIMALVFTFVAVWLWNYAVVSMFGLSEITYWKMFALLMLVRLFVPANVQYNNKS